jgi:outer membrane receptor for ferric coprogen and ferric-rhodotorulic acid
VYYKNSSLASTSNLAEMTADVLAEKVNRSKLLPLSAAIMAVSFNSLAQPPAEPERILTTVNVQSENEHDAATEKTGAYAVRRSGSATGLNQTLRETPQSVSVVTRARMDDFGLNNINDALDGVTGINVERVETDRFYYTARGFDIVNFQVDGIGIPLVYGNVSGDLDTLLYDRIDVVRGATGLVSGAGNPSAAINFVRKRPTKDLQASAEISYGSWNDKRMEGDVAGALNAAGSVRGRLVAAYQDRESHLDFYSATKGVFYGVVEADVGSNTLLTLGHTYQRNRPKGVLWGALPLYFDDGTPTDYDVSTSNSAEWTYWHTDTAITFAELQHDFANGWQAKAVFTHNDIESDSKLLYMYGTPVAGTDTGLFAWPAVYAMKNKQDLLNVRVNGPFSLAGREHELVLGASFSKSSLTYEGAFGDSLYAAVPSPFDGSFPEPVFNQAAGSADFEDKQRSLYAATRLQAGERLKLILGANHTHVESNGVSFGADRVRDEGEITPYAGVVYDLTRNVSAYASHTRIFMPQNEIGFDFLPLDPAEGHSNEVGVKGEWLDRRLNASLSVFKAKQDNLAEYAGFVAGQSIYQGVDTHSQGFEIEVGGEVLPGLKLSAGYSQLSIEDDAGDDVRTYTPRKLFNLSGTWQATPKLKLGTKLNWKGKTWVDQGGGVETRQSSYALVDLMAQYKVDKHWTASLNLNNVMDEKYLTSLMWGQSFYGAPRNVNVSLSWKY